MKNYLSVMIVLGFVGFLILGAWLSGVFSLHIQLNINNFKSWGGSLSTDIAFATGAYIIGSHKKTNLYK